MSTRREDKSDVRLGITAKASPGSGRLRERSSCHPPVKFSGLLRVGGSVPAAWPDGSSRFSRCAVFWRLTGSFFAMRRSGPQAFNEDFKSTCREAASPAFELPPTMRSSSATASSNTHGRGMSFGFVSHQSTLLPTYHMGCRQDSARPTDHNAFAADLTTRCRNDVRAFP